ncbi:hypothetical protein IWZ01DRAFT_478613 [Phyllosticta capitalensis]
MEIGFHSRSPAIPTAPLARRQPPPANDPLTLNVGGMKYVTTPTTLRGSRFFDNILSSDYWDASLQDDGSLFVDYDSEIFKHVLKYLRTGRLPSCFLGLDHGYDHEFAGDLKDAAKHFGIDRLHEWLDKKQYLEAVKVMTTTTEFQLKDFATSLYPGDESVQHHVSWVAKDVPVCPRGIPVHVEGSVFACGVECRKAAEENGGVASKQVIAPAIVVVRKKAVFNDKLCQPSGT